VLNTLRNALTVPDIRKRIGFVFFAFAVFVFMIHVQLPNVNQAKWNQLIQSGAFYQFLGFLSGGALQKLSIIAMGITPYINASIIMQLMTVVIPQLEEMAKKGGEEGRKTISRYTRYLTIVLGTVGTHAQSQSLYKKPLYKTETDFTPVALIAELPIVLITRKDLPVGNLQEFIAFTKANQGKMQFGSAGAGCGSGLSFNLPERKRARSRGFSKTPAPSGVRT